MPLHTGWQKEDMHQCGREREATGMQSCYSITRVVGQRIASWSQIFVSNDQDFSVDSNCPSPLPPLKKNPYILTPTHQLSFYPSGKKKKIKSKALSNLSKRENGENVPRCQSHQSSVAIAGNAALGSTQIINTFYIWHWFLACHFIIFLLLLLLIG